MNTESEIPGADLEKLSGELRVPIRKGESLLGLFLVNKEFYGATRRRPIFVGHAAGLRWHIIAGVAGDAKRKR